MELSIAGMQLWCAHGNLRTTLCISVEIEATWSVGGYGEESVLAM